MALLVAEDYVALLVPGAAPQRYTWIEVGACAFDSSDLVRLADALRVAQLQVIR